MPKVPKWVVLFPLLSVLGVVIFVLTRSGEPSYGGHALSYWVKRRAEAVKAGRSSQGLDESERALRPLGTNALPWLLRWIKHEPNPMPQFVLQRVEWSSWETPIGHLLKFGPGDALAASVPLAFDTLGTNAAPALNELVALMNDRAHPATSTRAIMALGSLGEFSLPALSEPCSLRRSASANWWHWNYSK